VSGPEFKALPAEITTLDNRGDHGGFAAVISTDAVDRDGESIAVGAFSPLPSELKVFYNHDWRSDAFPIGKAQPYYEGPDLKAVGTFSASPRAQELRALVVEGMVDSMSIGFLNAVRKTVGGKRVVTKGDLFEVSFTGTPVNPTARVLSAKAGARNSAADLARIQSIHDTSNELGAGCGPGGKSLDDDEERELLELRLRAINMTLLSYGIDLDLRTDVSTEELTVRAYEIEIRALCQLAGVDYDEAIKGAGGRRLRPVRGGRR
jgi:HK97 family phage prohead protease